MFYMINSESERDSLDEDTSPEAVIDEHCPMKLSSKLVSLLFNVYSCPHLLSKICIVQIVHTIFTRCLQILLTTYRNKTHSQNTNIVKYESKKNNSDFNL